MMLIFSIPALLMFLSIIILILISGKPLYQYLFKLEFYIQADPLQAINPVLILILIPTSNWIVYPFLAKCNLSKKPLQRMIVGMLFACIVFQRTFLITNSSPNSISFINLTSKVIHINSTKSKRCRPT